MATCHSTSKSFLTLQTCQLAFLRFAELWGTSCTHLQTSKMAKLDLVAFNFLAWRMLLWVLLWQQRCKPRQERRREMLITRSQSRDSRRTGAQTEGWEVSARSWPSRHSPWLGPCSSEVAELPRWAGGSRDRFLLAPANKHPARLADVRHDRAGNFGAPSLGHQAESSCLLPLKSDLEKDATLRGPFLCSLTVAFNHSPLLHRLFILPLISVFSFEIKATKMENVFALCSQRNKQGAFKKVCEHQREKIIYCGIQRQGQKSWLVYCSPVFSWNSWDIKKNQLQVIFFKDFETKAGKLLLPFFTTITVIKMTLALFFFFFIFF